MNKIEDHRKKIDELTETLDSKMLSLDDNFLLGYSEAILNILCEFTNGQCADCPFSYDIESYSPDFIYPEYDLKCKLDNCWIDTVKTSIRNDGENDMDHIQMLVSCAYMRGVPNLQHRTIAEFAQFVEDVMSDKPEYQKYSFDWNSNDAVERWVEKFHEYCTEYYKNIRK
jgi:hypothetical protein